MGEICLVSDIKWRADVNPATNVKCSGSDVTQVTEEHNSTLPRLYSKHILAHTTVLFS